MPRACFVMEQHLGHKTYYENKRRFINEDGRIEAVWVPVTYNEPGGAIERLSFVPAHLRGTMRGWRQVRSGLQQANADVVFFNTQVPAALVASSLVNKPYVIATDLTPIQYDAIGELYDHAPDRPGLLQSYKHRVNRKLLLGAAKLLPWSSWAARSLVDDYGVDARRIDVVAPGVDLERWRPADRSNGDGKLRILFVGGDFERKGGLLLMRAFQALGIANAELHLVTRSKLPNASGIIVHNDMQPNSERLIELFRKSDVFVLPTEAEAFGIAAVEASASGLPVIATASGGLVDIVEDGVTGYLVDAGDEPAFATRLRLLLADAALREHMGYAARLRARAHFDARSNAKRVVDHLLDAVAARRARAELAASDP